MRQNKVTHPKLSQMFSGNPARRLQKLSLVITVSIAGLLGTVSGAVAADPFAEGSKAFKAKQYETAAKCFARAIDANPRNHVAYYYHALSLHYAKDSKGARSEYARIIQNFPMSDAANYSRRALAIMDPALLKSIDPSYNPTPQQQVRSGSSAQYARPHSVVQSSGSSSSNDRLPDEARIPFTRDGGSIMLDGMFNNRAAKVLYDTGAESTIFGKNHLQSMGIPEPSGPSTNTSTTGGSVQKTWDMRMNIKIGSIDRKDFPVTIKESMLDSPSLGKTFFKEFTCNVDNNSRCLILTKQGSRAASNSSGSNSSSRASNDPYAIPFIKDDNDLMIVSVTIEGRSAQAAVDTGSSCVMMSKDMAKKYGVTVPDDAMDTMVNTTSAQMRGKKMPLKTLKMGPIEKHNVDAVIVDNYPFSVPLLGQSFFGDSSYTIDDAAKVIRFRR